MATHSKDLLHLETTNSSSLSSLGSKLLLCNKNKMVSNSKAELEKPNTKPDFSSVPKSQVLGKLKDFLGVMSEANERLQLDAKDSSEKYDIEVLNENESEYIEMDLMLGVADLHTPEAVAAAESAIAGHQPVISLAGASSESESGESSDSSDEDEDEDSGNEIDIEAASSSDLQGKRPRPCEEGSSSHKVRKQRAGKRPQIIELP
ncbi:hypothetical protein LIER_23657 [Lithospermum erythrorhizon]|uniref:Uncharacterized protein n=1 Tax=Lithospermum erythrorhizon TaxID=34254 RepID=A0AAV3QZP6_LITER